MITPVAAIAQPQPHEIAAQFGRCMIDKRRAAVPDLAVIYVLDLARLHRMLGNEFRPREYFIQRGSGGSRFSIYGLTAHGERVLDLVRR